MRFKWKGWANTPARKPLAVYSVVYVSAVLSYYVYRGADVPERISDLLTSLLYVCVGSYAATSAYETVNGPKFERPSMPEQSAEGG